jgi:SDR family mycofactocin-dependent oxidoreductase
MSRFAGRTALITGGARGQGLSHALAFAREGAGIVLCDIAAQVDTAPYPMASQDDLQSAQKQVEATGAACLSAVADVRDAGQLQAVVASAVERFGGLDIVCANAGISSYAPVGEMTTAMWQDMIDVNLTGVFNTVRAAVPVMTSAGYGRIIATGSMAGRAGHPHIAHYVAAKWGLIGLIKSVAIELGRTGVTANVVAPTNVDSEMIQHQAFYDLVSPRLESPTREDAAVVCRRMTAMGIPWIDISDVTNAVLFLADESARYITGEVLHVGAGANAMNSA